MLRARLPSFGFPKFARLALHLCIADKRLSEAHVNLNHFRTTNPRREPMLLQRREAALGRSIDYRLIVYSL